MLCTQNERAEKLNLEQFEDDFAVHEAHIMSFRELSTKTNLFIAVTISMEFVKLGNLSFPLL